jgi:putative lipoic acid-binding regulatory protein
MTEANETLFNFPCDYPLKVMGRHTDEFRSLVLGIVRRHAGEETDIHIAERPSKDGNYLALTCTFTAQSKAQLDALYSELTSCELVRFAL